MDNRVFVVSPSPHVRHPDSVKGIMWNVNIAFLPALFAGTMFFGLRALFLVLLSVCSAIGTEAFIQWISKKKITIDDGSAVITGILLAFCCSPSMPWWMPVLGSAAGIAVSKSVFGGLGPNIFNPALVGRAILLAPFPVAMTTWQSPFDAATCATPLNIIKLGLNIPLPSLWDLFIGRVGGSIGETSALAIVIGAGYLLFKRIITWHVPLSFIVALALCSWIFGRSPLFEVLAGGALLGAFFMATDMVTSPQTRKGEIVFGIGAGALTAIIRKWGGYPEGVCYSILLMNTLAPLIDRVMKPNLFGKAGKERNISN
ncbi:MAG: RnfABCDGE type electron transport complex subunit D [Candidatus Theseobacter exili]|nr:RnfABCDGE type electron transport complex subunit D [Candidatus Theseobacter exili]